MNVTKLIENSMKGFSEHATPYGQELARRKKENYERYLRENGFKVETIRAEDGRYYRAVLDNYGRVVKILGRIVKI